MLVISVYFYNLNYFFSVFSDNAVIIQIVNYGNMLMFLVYFEIVFVHSLLKHPAH